MLLLLLLLSLRRNLHEPAARSSPPVGLRRPPPPPAQQVRHLRQDVVVAAAAVADLVSTPLPLLVLLPPLAVPPPLLPPLSPPALGTKLIILFSNFYYEIVWVFLYSNTPIARRGPPLLKRFELLWPRRRRLGCGGDRRHRRHRGCCLRRHRRPILVVETQVVFVLPAPGWRVEWVLGRGEVPKVVLLAPVLVVTLSLLRSHLKIDGEKSLLYVGISFLWNFPTWSLRDATVRRCRGHSGRSLLLLLLLLSAAERWISGRCWRCCCSWRKGTCWKEGFSEEEENVRGPPVKR